MAEKLSVLRGNKTYLAGNGSANQTIVQKTATHCAKLPALSHNFAPYAYSRTLVIQKLSIFKTAPKKVCSALNARKHQPTAITI